MGNKTKVYSGKNPVFWMRNKFRKIVLGIIPFLLLFSILGRKAATEEGKAIRIAVARFSHETCTFCPRPTTIEDWEFYGPPTRDILNTDGGYIGGFKTICEEYGGIELVGITSPRGARGGSSGSWITHEAFDKYTNLITADLTKAGHLDGVFLSLHGAMAVTGIPKPEAEIVRRIRKVVADIPIMVTLDLHANEDHELSDAADAVFIIKRYPHYDTTLQGERAARTGVSPAMEIMERARRWECQNPGVYVSVAFGFAYADVPDVGATIMVVTNNDQKLADRIADDMSDYIWRMRKTFAGKKLPKTKKGVSLAIAAARAGKTPVVIADHSDRTGGSTHILEELIKQGAKNFCIATLRDERAIEQIRANHKIGDKISIDLGGYSDKYAGNPVRIEGKVEFLGDYGRGAVVVLLFGENNRVILTPQLMQVTTPRIFAPLGIKLDDLDIIILKSRVHFRRGFYETGLAGAIFEVDAPGWGPADLTTLPYKNIPKDIYPVYKKD